MIAAELGQLKSFRESCETDLLRLKEREGCRVADKPTAQNEPVFRLRLADEWKNKESAQEFAKSRLVIQAFNDKDHG